MVKQCQHLSEEGYCRLAQRLGIADVAVHNLPTKGAIFLSWLALSFIAVKRFLKKPSSGVLMGEAMQLRVSLVKDKISPSCYDKYGHEPSALGSHMQIMCERLLTSSNATELGSSRSCLSSSCSSTNGMLHQGRSKCLEFLLRHS